VPAPDCRLALAQVRELVGEHRGQLVTASGDADQAQVHPHAPARQCEGIEAAVAQQEDVPGEGLVDVGLDVAAPARRGHQGLPQGLHVVEQQRVVQPSRVAPQLLHDLFAVAALGGQGQGF
jgi:hypothetical protein